MESFLLTKFRVLFSTKKSHLANRRLLAGFSLSENPSVPIHLRRCKPHFVPGVFELGKLLHGYLVSRKQRKQIS